MQGELIYKIIREKTKSIRGDDRIKNHVQNMSSDQSYQEFRTITMNLGRQSGHTYAACLLTLNEPNTYLMTSSEAEVKRILQHFPDLKDRVFPFYSFVHDRYREFKIDTLIIDNYSYLDNQVCCSMREFISIKRKIDTWLSNDPSYIEIRLG